MLTLGCFSRNGSVKLHPKRWQPSCHLFDNNVHIFTVHIVEDEWLLLIFQILF